MGSVGATMEQTPRLSDVTPETAGAALLLEGDGTIQCRRDHGADTTSF